MNKTALRKFAYQARNKLKSGVKQKAYSYGIIAEHITPITELKDGLVVNGTVMGKQELKQYNHLKNRFVYEGYEQVIDEAAYTWFNRVVALRFMEVNGYLPIRMSILSSQTPGKIEPDALTHILELSEELDLDRELIFKLQDENKNEALYQYLLVKQCNKLGEIIPNVFDYISDDLALLLPDNLLEENSVIRDIVNLIDEEDWKDVEIVGWLYQFYISEQKDLVFSNLKKNQKIGKNDIPAATQLFTPRWIVEYMVDNSLGRLWLESHPDKNLQESLAYYLEDAEQTAEVLQQLEDLKNSQLNIEEIEFLDPCCGSGHILVYAFELFHKIYLSRGYSEREIPKLILENNLFGLDIDRRAAQLATFAVIMKARFYDARLFSRKFTVHIHSIEESNEITQEDVSLFAKEDERLLEETELLVDTFRDAKLYGSIIQVPKIDTKFIEEQMTYFKHYGEIDIFTNELVEYTLPLLEDLLNQYKILAKQYEVVVTNPPYKKSTDLNSRLNAYIKTNYSSCKQDLYTVFIKRCILFAKNKGKVSMITQSSFLFKSQFKTVREVFLKSVKFDSLIQLGAGTFEEINGEVVQSVIFTFKKVIDSDYQYVFGNLQKYKNAEEKRKHFFQQKNYDIKSISNALKDNDYLFVIPSILPEKQYNVSPKIGIQPGEKFIKLWWEILKENKEWILYNKGGKYRKWYGNLYWVINYIDEGNNILLEKGSLSNRKHFFKDHISFTRVSSNLNMRYYPENMLFDNTSPSIFEEKFFLLGYYNSKIAEYLRKTMFQGNKIEAGHIKKIAPDLNFTNYNKQKISSISIKSIVLAKCDWNSFEISWDFKKHPFLEYKSDLISKSFISWEEFTNEQFNQLKANEEELNRIFIDIYGLQDELTPEVEDKDVTVRKADKKRDVKSFLSYLIGIIFGRYSLDEEGLAYAGGEWDASRYKTHQPDTDSIIPITQEVFFGDDMMNKIEELVGIIYGQETLEENLLFIAEALGKKNNENVRECIRRYFIKDFYKDHLKIYQKRPIYWVFSSGKRGAFKGLVYLHRYDRDTIARIRTDYVLQQSRTLDNLIALEQHLVDDEKASRQAKVAASKAIENYLKDKAEISQYAEVLDHMAKKRIELDLDDGVKVNYAKFQNIEVVKDQAGKLVTMNLLENI